MLEKITYSDFDLLIESSEKGYFARVLNSPAGQAGSKFSLPFSDLELENILLKIGQTRRGVRRLESPEMELTRIFGKRLFEAVFVGDVRDRLRTSLNEVNRRGSGLRIRLRLSDAPELADIPWELLFDPALNRFFVLSVETPLVRYLELPHLIKPLAVKPPLHILVMIASPSDYPPLDTEKEWSKLKESLQDLERRQLVSLERLDEPSLAGLQRQLRRGQFHIFHFIGHGKFDEQYQDGVLLMEDATGRGRPVSGSYLGTMLHDHRPLRLAILNSCEGARTSRSDPFAGTAQSLVQQGIPAVIAMQFEITDGASIVLAHEFYSALADGYPVDAALSEARKAIFAQGNDVEWGTPVLYLCTPDGFIFEVSPQQPVTPMADAQLGSYDEGAAQRLEQLYTDGLIAYWLDDWEKAIQHLQAIVDVNPDYPGAAAKLEAAEIQLRKSTLYRQAELAQASGNLEEAVRSLEILLGLDPDYLDAAERLERLKKQKRLEELYEEARRLHEAQKWEAVIKVFNEIAEIDREYPDKEGLLTAAMRETAALKLRLEVENLYNRSVREMEAGEWRSAYDNLLRIRDLQPGYRETERLLKRLEGKMAPEALVEDDIQIPVTQAAGETEMDAAILRDREIDRNASVKKIYSVGRGLVRVLSGILAASIPSLESSSKASLWKGALSGAIGFGVGSSLQGPLYYSLGENENSLVISLVVWGLIGGASLGIPELNWKRIGFMGLVGAVGVGLGIFLNVQFDYPEELVSRILFGSAVGLALGASTRNLRKIIPFTLTGAMAFFLSNYTYKFISESDYWKLKDAIAGALLGVVLGSAWVLLGLSKGEGRR